MNKRRIYRVDYGNYSLFYKFLYPATRYQFKNYIKAVNQEGYDICSDEERIAIARRMLPEGSSDSYLEYRTLIDLTAKELLKYKCCIFHSISFLYRNYIWLLTAPSGTGKTTQYRNWINMFPDEIKMLCGDMPVLECREDGSIDVHPTSWNGKENIGSRFSGHLGGVILLKQGKKNEITELKAENGLIPLLEQFIVRPDTEEEIHNLMYILEHIFTDYPVLQMVNTGDEDSTLLLRERINTICDQLNGENPDEI